MEKKIKFCTMYLPCSDVELVKDVGQIPYTLSSLYDIDCAIACCNVDPQKNNNRIFDKVSIFPIKMLGCKEITGLVFLLKNAHKFDWINFYHGGRTVYYWSKLYHFLNPNGKIYLKLDMDFRLCDKYDKSKRERRIFKKTVESADLVSVESLAVRDRIQKYTKKKIEIISNGYQALTVPLDIARKRDNCFITVGRLGTKQKATNVLLEAFAVSANQHNWKLKLIGPVEESFKQYIKSFFERNPNLKERVIFMGTIKDRNILYNEYCRARVFLLPSKWEGFALVVGEALSCGCRVVVSDQVPPMNEFTNKGKYGAIVKVDDVEDLAKTITKETYRQYDIDEVESIRNYAERNFSWNEICLKLYKKMITIEKEYSFSSE